MGSQDHPELVCRLYQQRVREGDLFAFRIYYMPEKSRGSINSKDVRIRQQWRASMQDACRISTSDTGVPAFFEVLQLYTRTN